MRPVRLDLHGFAGFRDPATVDFTGADYFAFVGPTGSGKSTVVDAMTFALYGSAPRWGSVSSIQYALAPTANRGTVRLIFDVAGRRYVVAREVRRSGAQITQKSCALERFADPSATGDPDADEPTEVLAGDPKSVRQQVIDLLGLEFDDFCTCVVLPQGDFATFLKASVTERQNILLKLLGAKHYDAIGKLAGRRAADAAARVEVLTGQLSGYADATAEALAGAQAREAELEALQSQVRTSVELSTALAAAHDRIRTQLTRVTEELGRLAAVVTPDGVVELQAAVSAAEQAYHQADEQERQAATAAVDADRAVQAGPRRQALEETLRWRAELARGSERRAEVVAQEQLALRARADAQAAAAEAEGQLDQQRTGHGRALVDRDAAAARLAALEQRIAALRQVTVPAAARELGLTAAQLRAARDDAEARQTSAESEMASAQAAIAQLPERSALDALQRTIEEYQRATLRLDELHRNQQSLADRVQVAAVALQARSDQQEAALADLETLRTQAVAADLRPHLRTGEPCPVCEQSVATLPPPLVAPGLDAARTSLAGAEAQVKQAAAQHAELARQFAAQRAQLESVAADVDRLDRAVRDRLPETPARPDRDPDRDRAVVRSLLDRLTAALQHRDQAAGQLDRARTDWRTADQEAQRIETSTARSWAELHTLRATLATDRTPAVDASDLAGSWSTLAGWARMRADRLTDEELGAARAALDGAAAELAEAASRLAQAIAAGRAGTEALTAAAVAEQQARSDRLHLGARLDELESALTDRPSAEDAERLLAECARLEAEAEQARAQAHAASRSRQDAELAREASRLEQNQARAALHQARDALTGLGAPGVDDTDLAQAWTILTAWSQQEAEQRRHQLAELDAELADTDDRLDQTVAGLAATLDEHGVDLAAHRLALVPGSPDAAARTAAVPALLLVEGERARSRTAEIIGRRRTAEDLQGKIAVDVETQQVAAELQRLMSSRRFPQWLADAALDTLVADASASLLRLSNNQFDLTHERGEFYVIDHTDADSRRSVRTLSGGETFQASLALALALSEQLATLAAGGRTTLDSIFLDEGFGTLDPDALEIVAGTLENLTQEDRMVGVITHVTALAERIPVRYEVSRDSRTSSIVRIGP